MIANNTELQAALTRIAEFQVQVIALRKVISHTPNYRLSAGGFLAAIEKMQAEVRDYLRRHPTESAAASA